MSAVLVLAATGLYAILAPRAQPGGVGGNRRRARSPHEALFFFYLGARARRDKLLAAKAAGRTVASSGPSLILALGVFVATGFLTSLPPATAVKQEAPPRTSKCSKSN